MKIRTWNFSYNNHSQWKIGNVSCVERPLWVHLGEWFVESVIGRACCLLHWIKFPSFIKVVRDGETFTAEEYYGDLGAVFHCDVFNPIWQAWWTIQQKHEKEYVVKIGYDKLLEIFGPDFKELEPVREDDL